MERLRHRVFSAVVAIVIETTLVTVICRRHLLRLHRGILSIIVSITFVVSIGCRIYAVFILTVVVVILVVLFVIV